MKLYKLLLIALLAVMTGKSYAQAQIISGKVVEELAGSPSPLPGVNVNIVNAQNRYISGTMTDMNGFYKIQIPENEKNITITFSFIGMQSQRIKYTGQKVQNVTLTDNTEAMKEIVVTAKRKDRNDMGITQLEKVTATQKIKMDDLLSSSPVTTVEEALQGQLGGVDIITGGGDPGARSAIRIRGTSSLNASSEPLIVINGIPYSTDINDDFDFSTANNEDLGSLLNIAPSDIETVEVLKDAAATAIYGTKGANGVLLITTKRGREGKTNFSFSSKFTVKNEPATIPMLSGNEYAALMQDAIWNSANYIGLQSASNSYLSLLYHTPEIGYDTNWKYFKEYNQDTDWLKEIRQTATTFDNNFSVSGGGEKATYRFSLGYMSDAGTTVGTALGRFSTSLSVNYQFSNKLRFTADFAYAQSDRDANYPSDDRTVRSEAFSKMPNKSPYWIDDNGNRTSQYFSRQTSDYEGEFRYSSGKYYNYNPVAMVNEAVNNSIARDSRITFTMRYDDLLPGLTYMGWAAMNMKSTKNNMFLPQVATGVVWTDTYANRNTKSTSDNLVLQTENKLMYINNWEDRHNLILTALIRTSQTRSTAYTHVTSGNASVNLSESLNGNTVASLSSGESEQRSVSSIAMANYTYLGRYVFQASVTAEGNSAMGKDNRMGYFPTVGVSWNAQNEPFLKNAKDWLDEAKLRISVGQSGTAPSGSSVYLGAFSSLGQYMNMPAIEPSRMQLNKLKWETSTEYNIGADLGFFGGRLKFTADLYKKYKSDLLQKNVSIPTTTGYSSVKYLNDGKLTNQGYEFRVDGVLYERKGWRISSYLNLSRNENKITQMPDNIKQESYTFGNGNYAVRVEEGRPFGSFYGYRYQGVYQNKQETFARDASGNVMNDINGDAIIIKNGAATAYAGDAKYEDINHDGVINEYDIVYLGNYMPMVMGGAGFTVKYKQVALSTFFHGRFGQKIINATRMDNEAMYNVNNQSKATLKRWRNEGDKTDIPRALYAEGFNFLGSDRFVEDASFVRLKTLSLTYTFPKNLCRQLGVNSLNVFGTAYDLYTWTKYTGQDPEVSIPSGATSLAKDNANTPASVRFSCGFNLNF